MQDLGYRLRRIPLLRTRVNGESSPAPATGSTVARWSPIARTQPSSQSPTPCSRSNPNSIAPKIHNTKRTTGTGSSRNLLKAWAMGLARLAEERARGRYCAAEASG
jgi:hypothetical protein